MNMLTSVNCNKEYNETVLSNYFISFLTKQPNLKIAIEQLKSTTRLERIWDVSLPKMYIIMNINYNKQINEQNIQHIITTIKTNNYGGFFIVNINDILIDDFRDEKKIIIAWGSELSRKNNNKLVKKLTNNNNILYCFDKLKRGNPRIPNIFKPTDIILY